MRARSAIGFVMIGIALVASVPVVTDAVRNYQTWQTTTNDPSAKDAYLTFLQGDILLLVVLALVGTAGVVLLVKAHRTKRTLR